MKKNRAKVWRALPGLCLAILTGCVIPGGAEYVSRKVSEDSAMMIISGENLGRYFPAPATGTIPMLSFGGPYYTGTVEWLEGESPLTGNFKADTEYTAMVTLYAFTGYAFAVPATPAMGSFSYNYFAGSGETGAVIHGSASNSRTLGVLISFDATGSIVTETPLPAVPVTDLDLTAKIPAPVTGGIPVSSTVGTQYAVSVAWTPFATVFQNGQAYAATVTLLARQGYTFAGVAQNVFTHSGATTLTHPAGTDGTLVIAMAFLQTTASLMVTDLDLTAFIAKPVKGEMPKVNISSAQYAGTVTWSAPNGSYNGSAPFAKETAYTATVTLIAAPGWSFNGLTANSFVHADAQGISAADIAEGSVTVVITFPATMKDIGMEFGW
jgi:hypothetical protein